mgnify:CR=1 FL=1
MKLRNKLLKFGSPIFFTYCIAGDGGESGEGGEGGAGGTGGTGGTGGAGGTGGDTGGTNDPEKELETLRAKLQSESQEKARLLKEVMDKKSKLREAEEAREQAAKRLAEVDDLDIDKARKLLQQAEEAQRAELERKGEYQKLTEKLEAERTRLATEAEAKVNEAKTEAQKMQETVQAQLNLIENLTVGTAFSNSEFVASRMTLPPSKARVVYGSHFDVVDGEVVAFDKPRGAEDRTELKDKEGQLLTFNAAIEQIVQNDPDASQLIRSAMKPGSGSDGSDGGSGDTNKSASGLRGLEKIQFGLSRAAKS